MRLRPLILLVCCALRAAAADYFVAPNGDDANTGTETSPFATIMRGQSAAAVGDTVWLRVQRPSAAFRLERRLAAAQDRWLGQASCAGAP